MSDTNSLSPLSDIISDSWQSDRRVQVLLGAGVIVLSYFVSWLPLMGSLVGFVPPSALYFTGIIKIAGGLAGGATVGSLRQRGGYDGVKYGFVTGVVGTILSYIFNLVPIAVTIVETTPGPVASYTPEHLLGLILLGVVPDILMLVVGGTVGGGLAGLALQRYAG